MPTSPKRDLAEKHGAEPEADAPLHLRADDIWVYGLAAIDRHPHLVHAWQSVLVGYFGDLRNIGVEALVERHPARPALRHRAAPAGDLSTRLSAPMWRWLSPSSASRPSTE